MAENQAGALDVRIEVEKTIAPMRDLLRENAALLRGVVEELHDVRTRIDAILSRLDD